MKLKVRLAVNKMKSDFYGWKGSTQATLDDKKLSSYQEIWQTNHANSQTIKHTMLWVTLLVRDRLVLAG